MKFIKFLFLGVLFGIILSKAEVISWYRIYEMFRFQSFHMYGIIGSAIVVGAIMIQIIKRKEIKSVDGNKIHIEPKERSVTRYLIGGIVFGLGWALTGACPGPMFTLVGNDVSTMIIAIIAATLGTYVYGRLKHRLPH